MAKAKSLADSMIEDDAWKYLKGLSEEERRPLLEPNELEPSGPAFTKEEEEIAYYSGVPR